MDENWTQCRQAFLRAVFDRSGSIESLRTYSRILDRFLGDGRSPECYLRSDVENFIHKPCEALQCEPGQLPSPATVAQRLTVIKSFYAYAAAWTIPGPDGWPVALMQRINPASGIRRGQPVRAYKAMSLDDLKALFSVIPRDTVAGARDFALLTTLFLSCRRRSEILRLVWGDLQRMGELTVFKFYGKGHSRQEDFAEMPALAMSAIEHYLQLSGRMASIKPSDPIFTAVKRGGRQKPGLVHLSFVAIYKLFARYLDAAGLTEKGYTVHSLRHSSAQQRMAAGESILSLQKTLRHQNLQTTSIYLQQLVTPEDDGARLLAARMSFLV